MSTITDLIVEQGRAAAAARAASGQILGRAIDNVSQAPAQIIAAKTAGDREARLATTADQENQLRAAQLAGAQKQQADSTLTGRILGSGLVKEDGTADADAMAKLARDAGRADLVPHIVDQVNKWNSGTATLKETQAKADEAQLSLQNARRDQLGVDAQGLIGSDKQVDPDLLKTFIASRVANGTIPKDQGESLTQRVHDDPAQALPVVQSFLQGSKTVQTQRAAGMKEVPKEGTLVNVNDIDPTTGKPRVLATGAPADKKLEQKPVLLDGKSAIVNYDPATGKHTDAAGNDVSARVKPIPPASTIINPAMIPSGTALDIAAQRYNDTGDLPAMGMGSAGAAARVAVMNRAAEMNPTVSLARNKAIYKADSANLSNLQKTEGTLSAFEKTAGKNLDQFLSLADKIPDTGVPWLNQPVRAVNSKLLGDADQAAFNAARDVALREIARVTNDPKLSGVLSDAARKEVSSLSGSDATFAQIKAVAKVLKQDMANVHAGINDQIDTVKTGLQGNPSAASAGPAVGERRMINGQLGEWDGKGWKAAVQR